MARFLSASRPVSYAGLGARVYASGEIYGTGKIGTLVGHSSCTSAFRDGRFEAETDRTLGDSRRASQGMTAVIRALAALLAFAGPDKGSRLGIPAAGGGFQPGDQILRTRRRGAVQGSAFDNALDGLG